MKYLLNFNESNSYDNIREIKTYLDDVLLELEDIGLIVDKSFLYCRKSIITSKYNDYESHLDEFNLRGDKNVGIQIKIKNSINRIELSNIYYPISHFIEYIKYIFPKVLLMVDFDSFQSQPSMDYFYENHHKNWNELKIVFRR